MCGAKHFRTSLTYYEKYIKIEVVYIRALYIFAACMLPS